MSSQRSYGGGAEAHNASALPRALRPLVALLRCLAGASSLALLAAVLLANDPPVAPPVLIEAFALWIALPALAVSALVRAHRAALRLDAGELVIERAQLRIEVPLASIQRAWPWRVPLPAPGIELELRSGRRLPVALQLRDPLPLLRELAAAGVHGADEALRAPGVLFAHARAPFRPIGWRHWLARFPLFALLPTALVFNVHQQITHGGLLGEYYLLGVGSYLRTFASYWAATTVYLVLFAAALRALVELACWSLSRVAPSDAQRARRAAERVGTLAYYAGVPSLLALRFLP